MARVQVVGHVQGGIESVWELIGDFGGLEKLALGVESCTVKGSGVGAERTLTFPNNNIVVERLESHDPVAKTFSYSIVRGGMPISNYLGLVRLTPNSASETTVELSCTFDPAGMPEALATDAISGGYRGILKALQSRI